MHTHPYTHAHKHMHAYTCQHTHARTHMHTHTHTIECHGDTIKIGFAYNVAMCECVHALMDEYNIANC